MPLAKLVGREEEVAAAWAAGASYDELAKRFGVHRATISRALARADRNGDRRTGRRSKLFGRQQEVVRAFGAGASRTELAARFGVSPYVISRALTAAGVQRNKGPWRKAAEVEQAMADAYLAGATLDAVAADFGCSRTVVKRAVLDRGGTIHQKGPRAQPAVRVEPDRSLDGATPK